MAIDASTTHLYNPGTRIHIANALKLGVTRDEVMEVLEIVSVLGIHTMSTGLPILIDELRKAGRGAEVKEGPLTAEHQFSSFRSTMHIQKSHPPYPLVNARPVHPNVLPRRPHRPNTSRATNTGQTTS